MCAVVTSLAVVSYGYFIKTFGDKLQLMGAGEDLDGGFLWLSGLIIAATIIRAVSLYGMTLANNIGVQRALIGVSNTQFGALMDGDYSRLTGASSGGFVSRFINDLNTLRDFGLRLANNAIKSVVTVVGALAGMFWMDWQLALVLLVVYPLAFGPVIALGNRVRKRAKRSQEQVGEVTSLLTEGFQSARTVTAYGLEDYQKTRAAKGFAQRAKLYLKVLSDKAGVDPILEIAGGIAIAGVLGFSAWRISQEAATLGDFLGFITLIGVAAPEARALGSLNALAQEARAATQRLYELVDERPTVIEAEDAKPLAGVSGTLVFDDVRFGYNDSHTVLDGLSFRVNAGETVALVGASGAGKSTVFNLLLRLFDVSGGRISVDGQDIRALRLAQLRGAIGLVEQEPALFDDTIGANIALGRLGAQEAEIVAAAKNAHAHGFIVEMAEGYHTPVGERGGKLSGGQRQRVALARAILRDAPILLLDEATSALDGVTEAAVQDALDKLSKDRTVLVIAHRLASVKRADRILVIEGGRLVEEGSHEALLKADGAYARFAREQFD